MCAMFDPPQGLVIRPLSPECYIRSRGPGDGKLLARLAGVWGGVGDRERVGGGLSALIMLCSFGQYPPPCPGLIMVIGLS